MTRKYFQIVDSTTTTTTSTTTSTTTTTTTTTSQQSASLWSTSSDSDIDPVNKRLNRLHILLIGNVIDAVSSFAVSQPKNICILDEVITSSREYKAGEASGWDDFLVNGRSDMWDRMKVQSKASLQYISKKRIPLKKINQMKYIGERNFNNIFGVYPIERGCFADVRLEKVVEVNVDNTDITDADMADLGRACPNMQKLNIRSCYIITDVGLIEFSRYCHGLKDIDMSWCNIRNAGLIEFSQNCPGLNRIDLYGCNGIVDGKIELLSQHCRELQYIRMSGSICSDADLLALSINCQQLQEIYLDGCNEVTDDNLIEMSKHFNNKQFYHITKNKCNLISNRGVVGFSKNCPQLKSIEIYGDNFTDDCLIGVTKNCTGLESIDISCNNWVTNISMNAIAMNGHGLKYIYIGGCTNITEASFINLIENCTGLESICIPSNQWMTDISMNAIAQNCHGLKNIDISGCTNITEAGRKAVDEGCPGVIIKG